MMIQRSFLGGFFFPLLAAGPKLRAWDPVKSPSPFWSAFFDRTSEALNSKRSRPASVATSVAEVVFPIPGGPDKRAAFQGPPGFDQVFFAAAGLLNCLSHDPNHLCNLITFSLFPRISREWDGACRSAHSWLGSFELFETSEVLDWSLLLAYGFVLLTFLAYGFVATAFLAYGFDTGAFLTYGFDTAVLDLDTYGFVTAFLAYGLDAAAAGLDDAGGASVMPFSFLALS
mmetsp:Transcript_32032/g.77825  ORF Transcript_32032/g.77825 Transcript_32032/m.77825 type:complete len:229 (-) Transcript_32032:1059-1745(-)